MYKVYLFLLLACLCLLAEAQLTFTSSWGGKRSAGPMGPMGPVMQMGSMGPIPPCKNDDAVAAIYKMIQTEAERLILCQKS